MNQIAQQNKGFSLIEMLVTLLILLLGLLGLAGLMAKAQQSEMESYQRVQALILLREMAASINANRKAAPCYALTTNTAAGTPYLGTGAAALANCAIADAGTEDDRKMADKDLAEWSDKLTGAGEKTAGGTNTGVMIGARGCITAVSTNSYLITVVWQGLGETAAPPASLTCASGLYGNEALRRAVSLTVQVATLL